MGPVGLQILAIKRIAPTTQTFSHCTHFIRNVSTISLTRFPQNQLVSHSVSQSISGIMPEIQGADILFIHAKYLPVQYVGFLIDNRILMSLAGLMKRGKF